MLVTGPLNDWLVVWMSQRNSGIYEPEYRLVFMLSMLVGVAGYLGWAIGSDRQMPWIGPAACMTYVPFSSRPTTTRLAQIVDMERLRTDFTEMVACSTSAWSSRAGRQLRT